ncbi:MAG: acyl-ACP--UDP-N-acetylglucosamine O-acyltransferase [Runella slithyformis]|nr:MAG: acyl-ACP--UDP-N-acetylglucosamine O-acyltransferase [Runella slithyformis]TAG24853.1 MAG: acyl-ACP--UDP-N-acetylglucosamine O-acyltransferase [Cytophagales bacterium]TAG42447.1 MAG: acyl-ACP--UDP-N-acetylglucosamine O-acyltransferase [Cytophagia bacterium]TAF78793.1 MAG: acyl-ACP--UDP-N-acetylglucosamine O-acyltransferase [Runella slithyformis]TAG57306.1 MAG: acyl-ACP--UDP-N-acetylglucosamine O-acyltransferase [Runella slithyformis]
MIQPLAYIHPEAKIAQNVVIEPFAIIHKDVEIGQGTWIGSHAVINEGARIGKNCRIFSGAVISSIPQDLKFNGEYTITIIGDNTTVREYATISRGTEEYRKTEIGSDCLIMAYAHIAHDCRIGNHCIIVNNVQLGGHVHLGDWGIIGGSSSVHQWVKIGQHAMISGGSLVRKDVPPFTKAAREPLSYAGVNSIGLRRRGYANEQIAEIQEIYRYLYLRGLNNSEALEQIEIELPPSAERDEILNFVRTSERGIIKAPSNNAPLVEE